MANGSKSSRANGMLRLIRKTRLILSLLFVQMLLSLSAGAEEKTAIELSSPTLSPVTWSDRITEETADGQLIDYAPFVAVKGVKLRRFNTMQRVTLHDTIISDAGAVIEKIMVFRVWQGGASKGEQLVLLILAKDGIELIGPYKKGFETMEILSANKTEGPLFLLYGGDDAPHSILEYVDGELLDKK